MTNSRDFLKVLRLIVPIFITSVKKYKLRFSVAIVLLGLSILFNILLPIALKSTIHELNNFSQALLIPLSILVGYIVLWLLSQVSMALREFFLFKIITKGIRELSINAFENIISLSMKIIVQQKIGHIINILDRAKEAFPNVFWGLIFYLIPNIIEVFIAIVILYTYYGIFYASLLFSTLFIFVLYTILSSFNLLRLQGVSNKLNAEFSAQIADTLINIDVVHFFNKQKYEVDRMQRYVDKCEYFDRKTLEYGARQNLFQGIIISIGFVMLTISSGYAVSKGQLHVSDFVLINSYLIQFAMPLKYLGTVLQTIKKSLTNIIQLNSFFQVDSIESNKPINVDLNSSQLKIEFKNVSFGYSRDRVLKNVSFTVKSGQSIAIVGSTGAGKSTLIKLLCKQFVPDQGLLSINDIDLSYISKKSLFENITVVPQSANVFNRSVKENIQYGNSDVTDFDLSTMVSDSQLDSIFSKTLRSMHSKIGENGSRISGGEKQKIAIARALLRDAPIILLDEATSSLDMKSEFRVLNSLFKCNKNKIIVVVSHRLKNLVNVDRIVLIDKGEVKAVGTHDELLKRNEFYANLWQK